MKRPVTYILPLMLCWSCAGPGNEKEVTQRDSTLIPIPSYSNVPVDTDDHNKGTVSEVTLDSPIGPPPDTAKKEP